MSWICVSAEHCALTNLRWLLQVFSRFTVVATTLTCIYFVDDSGVASKTGLDAAAVLVLLLNAFFLLVLAVLIVRAGMSDGLTLLYNVVTAVKKLFRQLVGLCCCARDRRPDPRHAFVANPGVQLSNRGSSMELLRNTIFSKSGTIIEHGDSVNIS